MGQTTNIRIKGKTIPINIQGIKPFPFLVIMEKIVLVGATQFIDCTQLLAVVLKPHFG